MKKASSHVVLQGVGPLGGAKCLHCADEFAAFLSRLRELSAEFRGKVVNVKSGYWKDKPTEMTKKYKEIADTLDALLGERVTEGSERK